MIPKAEIIAQRLETPANIADPLVIRPTPDLDELRASGAAAVDLRLGCWFLTFRQSRLRAFDVYDHQDEVPSQAKLTKTHYVPFGQRFVLHPRSFVLAATMEWIRLPADQAAYVVGKSRWGRHGLIIATATGVHPGFAGCLTLELTNVGVVPISIKPGTKICQLFFHEVAVDDAAAVDKSGFVGRRRPTLGAIRLDEVAEKLSTDLA